MGSAKKSNEKQDFQKHSLEIWGSNVSCAYLAAYLSHKGHNVDWFLKNPVRSLRPFRIRRSTLQNCIELMIEYKCSVSALLKAPNLKVWQNKNGWTLRHSREEKSHYQEKWIEEGLLFEGLKSCALKAGASIQNVAEYPESTSPPHKISIVAAPAEELKLWRQRYLDKNFSQRPFYSMEWVFPRVQGLDPQRAHCYKLSNAYLFLEAATSGGFVASLVGHSAVTLRDHFKQLKNSRQKDVPFAINALFAANPLYLKNEIKSFIGASGLYIPGHYLLNPGIGSYSPLSNQGLEQELHQAFRLLEHLRKNALALKASELSPSSFRSAQQWRQTEEKIFQKKSRLHTLWEKLMLNPDESNLVLSTHALLPSKLKNLLQIPF